MTTKFSGALATKLDPTDDAMKTLVHALEKIALLYAHYGIAERDEDGTPNWPLLVFAMAHDFVPGFQVASAVGKRGRPKRNLAKMVILLADVQRLVEERGCSVSEAVHVLITSPKPEFKERWGGHDKRTLENAFYEARKCTRVINYLGRLHRQSSRKLGS